MAFTVTATQGGSKANGIAMELVVVTGAGSVGATTGATQITPSHAITPDASGSWVYCSVLLLAGGLTAVAGCTIEQDVGGGGLEFGSVRTTGTTTGGTPVTVGVTSDVSANSISICLAEIEASGTLAEDASTPAGSGYVLAEALTSASFTPPSGALLVAMVQSNGAGSATTMAMTDTSGLGLTWVEQVKQNTAGDGYSGVWTAQLPSGGTNADAGNAASTGAGNNPASAVRIGMTIQGV